MKPIIEIEELMLIHLDENVLLFDVGNGKAAQENYRAEHLLGARFIDLNETLSNIKSDYAQGGRHPLPELEAFSITLGELGISENTHLVLYDDKFGANAAARFWWMLKSIGHEKVQVLNGGFAHAKKSNFPMSSSVESPNIASGTYPMNTWLLPMIQMEQVDAVLEHDDFCIIDVREFVRYSGQTEPIDLIAGHIPGAINIPFTENLNPMGLFLSPRELKSKYEGLFQKFDVTQMLVHCGSGVTACHTLLAMDYAGLPIPNLYVGSWSEWSRNNKKMITL